MSSRCIVKCCGYVDSSSHIGKEVGIWGQTDATSLCVLTSRTYWEELVINNENIRNEPGIHSINERISD
jgi:hypothetical protein